MSKHVAVTIIGAGPYGLAAAAHLMQRGVACRVIGRPMQGWSDHMPKGMSLKSEGFASNIYDPDGRFTLARYCQQRGLPYADLGLPVPLETFVDYGLAFQRRCVPHVEDQRVVQLAPSGDGFELTLSDGSVFTSSRVVIATGLSGYECLPDALAHLPPDATSHSSAHRDLSAFRGRDVLVIGGGASAVDTAVLLHESGASVQLVSRRPLELHDQMRLPRSFVERIRSPVSGIGPSWRSCFFTTAPMLFRHLPETTRHDIVRTYLGPAAGWFMRERLRPVRCCVGRIESPPQLVAGRVHVAVTTNEPEMRTCVVDHVIAATGYVMDARRLRFLSAELLDRLTTRGVVPCLSANFESIVSGLYLVGPAAAPSFGPVMRFAFGAGYTARRVSKHLSHSIVRRLWSGQTIDALAGRGQRAAMASEGP
jgi:thioredoxin reductase